jgi:uncharacterized protein YcfJ
VNRNARVEDRRYAPPPVAAYDYRRRGNERLYEANVVAVHAVIGTSGERCWIEREQVQDRGSANIPGALMGAVIGGILGHQVGSGRGNDAATAGGAIAGAAVGSQVGRSNDPYGYSQEVQRCTTNPRDATPSYWDVTYQFRGREYRVQMATPPGRTVRVNAKGEPRI